jgi:hypothetical protein
MTDTTTTPAWLAAAEAEHAESEAFQARNRQRQAENEVAAVNAALAQLGIEPLRHAYADAGHLVPALLLEPDPEQGHYGVHAAWSKKRQKTELLTDDWESRWPELRCARPLNEVGDVLKARAQGPAPHPVSRPDYQGTAERSLGGLREDYIGPDAAAIVNAVNGLTAAVLHLAQLTAKADDRP